MEVLDLVAVPSFKQAVALGKVVGASQLEREKGQFPVAATSESNHGQPPVALGQAGALYFPLVRQEVAIRGASH